LKTPTEVIIGLARADYQRLLHEVPSQHPAYTVLRRCPDFDRWADEKPFSLCVLIECSQEQAMALYEAAQQHCPVALRDIEYALEVAQPHISFRI
jgi:hypothetical protein